MDESIIYKYLLLKPVNKVIKQEVFEKHHNPGGVHPGSKGQGQKAS